jgi:Fe-S-cluster containining protein
MSASPTRTFDVDLDFPEGRVQARLELPRGPMRLAEFAEALLPLASEVSSMGERIAGRMGEKVSCRKGCGACCRQLVPVSPAEAYMIADLVDSVAEPYQSRIRDRFAKVEEYLKSKGMLDRLNALHERDRADDEHKSVAREYFFLGVPCPFLQDESCAIHEFRPAICREYLVTSPAENCKNPFANPIRKLPVSLKLTEALVRLSADLMGGEPRAVPLPLALTWVANHPAGRPLAADSEQMLNALLHHLRRGIAETMKNVNAQNPDAIRDLKS